MLNREDHRIQAVMQVVPQKVIKKPKEWNLKGMSSKEEPSAGIKSVSWADPLIEDTLSEAEVWKMILAATDVKPQSSRELWQQIRQKHLKRGNLQIHKTSGVPIYLADVDRMRNFRSLTAGAAVKDRRGRWNNLDIIVDTGAAVTLMSEKTYNSMDLPGKLFEGVDVPLLDASGNSMKVRGLIQYH